MFEKLLSIIGKRLDLAGIPYMIIGGQAVLLYGEPRLTRDIDLEYIRNWLSKFDRSMDEEIFLDQFERIYENVGTRS